MNKWLTIITALVSSTSFSQSSTAEKLIQSGNDNYKQQQFAKAAEEYSKALEAEPANATAKFNQANALYKQDKKVDAVIKFAEVANNLTGKEIRSKAFYNKGVILTQQKNLEESIEAYKNALRNNADDQEARENLQKALLELKKKNADKKKENDKPKKEEQKKQSQPKMKPKEAEQRLKLLQQKEKEVQQRVQKEKTKTGGSKPKDW
jgi:tetratricopeptide (TPR) repeat protein